jgi:hypothetical protein
MQPREKLRFERLAAFPLHHLLNEDQMWRATIELAGAPQ